METAWLNAHRHGLEMSAECLALASAVLIWLPAYRMTRRLKGATISGQVAKAEHGVVSDKAKELNHAFVAALASWERRDSLELVWGIGLAALASAVKLGMMVFGVA